MAKTYEKLGGDLKESETKTEEKIHNLKSLKAELKLINSRIDDLKAYKDDLLILINKAIELKVDE